MHRRSDISGLCAASCPKSGHGLIICFFFAVTENDLLELRTLGTSTLCNKSISPSGGRGPLPYPAALSMFSTPSAGLDLVPKLPSSNFSHVSLPYLLYHGGLVSLPSTCVSSFVSLTLSHTQTGEQKKGTKHSLRSLEGKLVPYACCVRGGRILSWQGLRDACTATPPPLLPRWLRLKFLVVTRLQDVMKGRGESGQIFQSKRASS